MKSCVWTGFHIMEAPFPIRQHRIEFPAMREAPWRIRICLECLLQSARAEAAIKVSADRTHRCGGDGARMIAGAARGERLDRRSDCASSRKCSARGRSRTRSSDSSTMASYVAPTTCVRDRRLAPQEFAGALSPGDTMTCTYRGHGAPLALSSPPDQVFSEIVAH
jgi:hypothetical protein